MDPLARLPKRLGRALNDRIAPVNALDLHGEDLIDDAKLKQIVENNESSADSQRWAAGLSLRGRDLTEANLRRSRRSTC
jgi:hypothetical protein